MFSVGVIISSCTVRVQMVAALQISPPFAGVTRLHRTYSVCGKIKYEFKF